MREQAWAFAQYAQHDSTPKAALNSLDRIRALERADEAAPVVKTSAVKCARSAADVGAGDGNDDLGDTDDDDTEQDDADGAADEADHAPALKVFIAAACHEAVGRHWVCVLRHRIRHMQRFHCVL